MPTQGRVELRDLFRSMYWEPFSAELRNRQSVLLARLRTCEQDELKYIQGQVHILEVLLSLPDAAKET